VSEVLYFMGDRAALGAVGRKIAAALSPVGQLITAHAHLLVDDANRTGFDWDPGVRSPRHRRGAVAHTRPDA
jgi:hypothetical protein